MLVCATIRLAPLLVAVAAQNSRRTARTGWRLLASTCCFRGENRAGRRRKIFYHRKLAAGRKIEVKVGDSWTASLQGPRCPIKGWFARDSSSCFPISDFPVVFLGLSTLTEEIPVHKVAF
jgi:hypothetical protein